MYKLLFLALMLLSTFAHAQSSVGYRINCNDVDWKFFESEQAGSAQTNNELVAAPGAGLSLYVTKLIFSNGATAGDLKLVENTASAVDVYENIYAGINGGAVVDLADTPIKITANTNLGFTSATVTTHSISVGGCIAP